MEREKRNEIKNTLSKILGTVSVVDIGSFLICIYKMRHLFIHFVIVAYEYTLTAVVYKFLIIVFLYILPLER
uniref:Uncharacterized protein n=1 Tax=Octopus bimaculoides TaxID=37653 RepID=A0A0L8GG29_OCTBM